MNKRLNLQYCTSDLVLNTIYTEPLLMQYTVSLGYSVSNISVGSYAGTMTQETKPQPKFHTAV
jgi:Na+/melibiose symporter-like transporter